VRGGKSGFVRRFRMDRAASVPTHAPDGDRAIRYFIMRGGRGEAGVGAVYLFPFTGKKYCDGVATGGGRARGVGFGEAAGRRFNSVAFCEVIFRLLALDSVCAGVERFPVPLACRVSKSEQFPFSVCPLSPTSFGVRQCKQPVMANRNRRGSARPAAKNAVTGFGGRVHHPRRTTYRSDPTQHRFSGFRQRSGGLSGVVASKGGTRKPSCAVGSGNLSDAGGLDRS